MLAYGDKVDMHGGGELLKKSVLYSLRNNMPETDGHYRCCQCVPCAVNELLFVICSSDGSAFSKLSKPVRHTILQGVVFDVDHSKAGASILLALASKYELEAKYLQYWVEDENSEISNLIMGEMGTNSSERLKLAVNVALYGDRPPTGSGLWLYRLHQQVTHSSAGTHHTPAHNTQQAAHNTPTNSGRRWACYLTSCFSSQMVTGTRVSWELLTASWCTRPLALLPPRTTHEVALWPGSEMHTPAS